LLTARRIWCRVFGWGASPLPDRSLRHSNGVPRNSTHHPRRRHGAARLPLQWKLASISKVSPLQRHLLALTLGLSWPKTTSRRGPRTRNLTFRSPSTVQRLGSMSGSFRTTSRTHARTKSTPSPKNTHYLGACLSRLAVCLVTTWTRRTVASVTATRPSYTKLASTIAPWGHDPWLRLLMQLLANRHKDRHGRGCKMPHSPVMLPPSSWHVDTLFLEITPYHILTAVLRDSRSRYM